MANDPTYDDERDARDPNQALLAPELRATVALQELWNLACPFVSPPPLWPMVRHAAVVEPFPRIFTRDGIATAARYLDHASARYRVRANLFLMEALKHHPSVAADVTEWFAERLRTPAAMDTAVECGVVNALADRLVDHFSTLSGLELEEITRCLNELLECHPQALWTINQIDSMFTYVSRMADLCLDRYQYDWLSAKLLRTMERIAESEDGEMEES